MLQLRYGFKKTISTYMFFMSFSVKPHICRPSYRSAITFNAAWCGTQVLVTMLNMSHMPSSMFLCACMYLVILGDGSSLWLWASCTWSKYHCPRFLSCFTLTYAGQPHLFYPFSVLWGSSPFLPSCHPSLEHTQWLVSLLVLAVVILNPASFA